MPLSFLLATIACFFTGNTVAQFSKYMPSSGGYYSFTSRGLGSHVGFVATWSYLIYDFLGPAGTLGFLGYLMSDTLKTQFAVNVPWWLLATAIFAIVWFLTRQGIRLSMQTTALLGGLELLIMLALAITFPDPSGARFQLSCPAAPLLLAASIPGDHRRNGLGCSLAQRLREPGSARSGIAARRQACQPGRHLLADRHRDILHLHILCERHRLGHGKHGGLCQQSESLFRSWSRACGEPAGGSSFWLSSTVRSRSGLACTNSASRVMYTMGRAGTLPARFGKIHPVHQTPSFAIAFQQMFGHCGGASGGLLVAAGIYFRLSRNDRGACRHRSLFHGESGADILCAADAPGELLRSGGTSYFPGSGP